MGKTDNFRELDTAWFKNWFLPDTLPQPVLAGHNALQTVFRLAGIVFQKIGTDYPGMNMGEFGISGAVQQV